MSFNDCGNMVIDANLTASITYYIVVWDRYDNQTIVETTSGSDGSITIDPTVFTFCFWNTFGNYEIQIATTAAGTTIVPMTISGTAYNCVIATMDVNCASGVETVATLTQPCTDCEEFVDLQL
jgi:hypothetical protein